MGGDEPARTLIAAALGAGQARRHRQQARHRPPRPGARGDRPPDRRGAAVRGGGRRRDPGPRAARARPRRQPRSTRVRGIVNGTTNYILSAMTPTTAARYDDVLAEAQELGYAEADPSRRRRGRRRGQQAGDPRPARVRPLARPGSDRDAVRRRRAADRPARASPVSLADQDARRRGAGPDHQAAGDRRPTRRRIEAAVSRPPSRRRPFGWTTASTTASRSSRTARPSAAGPGAEVRRAAPSSATSWLSHAALAWAGLAAGDGRRRPRPLEAAPGRRRPARPGSTLGGPRREAARGRSGDGTAVDRGPRRASRCSTAAERRSAVPDR